LIQKILIYKDPKELSSYKHNINRANNLTDKFKVEPNPRRPSVTLGMQISGGQNLADVNTLGALVTYIEPGGLVDKYNVSIKEGDEIMEINGINLRNKDDQEIDEILNSTCQTNNGEIELLIRRSSTMSSMSSSKAHSNSDTSSKSDRCNESIEKQSNEPKRQPDIVEADKLSTYTKSHRSMTSSPILATKIIEPLNINTSTEGHQLASLSSVSSSSSTVSSSTCSSSQPINKLKEIEEITYPQPDVVGHRARHSKSDSARIYHEFNEISIKRKNPKQSCEVIMSDPAVILASKYLYNHARQTYQQKSRSVSSSLSENQRNNMSKRNHETSDQPVDINNNKISTLLSPTDNFNTRQNFAKKSIKLDQFRASNLNYSLKSNNSLSLESRPRPDDAETMSYTTSGISSVFSSTNLLEYKDSNEHSSSAAKLNGMDLISNGSSCRNSGDDINCHKTLSDEPNHLTLPVYNHRTSSMDSIMSASRKSHSESKKIKNLGSLQIQLSHNSDEQQLVVNVLRARNLIAMDSNGFSDPFVKICLLPGREYI